MKSKSFAYSFAFALSVFATGQVFGQIPSGNEDYGYDGFLEPVHDVLLSAIEIGRIERIDVKVGDRVVAGQELATLEDSLQVISLEIAKNQAMMKGEQQAAPAERAMQTNRVAQLRTLFESGTARPDELTRAETDLMVADARVLVAQEEQRNRELEYKRQEIQLQRRKVISPITGIVARVLRQPGEYITPGESAIVRVIAKNSLIAVFNLPASDAMQLRVGQVIPLRPRTIPRAVEGTVESISPAIDGESGTVAVRIVLDNSDEVLFPGDRCIMGNVRQLAIKQSPADAAAQKRTAKR